MFAVVLESGQTGILGRHCGGLICVCSRSTTGGEENNGFGKLRQSEEGSFETLLFIWLTFLTRIFYVPVLTKVLSSRNLEFNTIFDEFKWRK